jgi:hypothetical protein
MEEYKSMDYFDQCLMLEVAQTAMYENALYIGLASNMEAQDAKNQLEGIHNTYEGYEPEETGSAFENLRKGLADVH